MSSDHFQDFVEQTQKVKNVDELVGVLLKKIKQFGYDRMIFCLFSDHAHIGLSSGVGYINNYPEDWMKYYMEHGFDRIDPVISYLRTNPDTFTWNEMATTLDLSKSQKLCLNLGEEAKLHNGIATPIWGPNRFSAVGFACSEKNDSCDSSPVAIDIINALSNQFYLVFERLHQKKINSDKTPKNIFLTPQEHDVLTWAAKGKSNTDIADIMYISISTVKYHIQNIYKKLGVNDRVVACAKAISLGLIHP